MIPCDVTACHGRLYKESAWMTEKNVDRLVSPWSANVFGALSAVRASKLLDAERRISNQLFCTPERPGTEGIKSQRFRTSRMRAITSETSNPKDKGILPDR
ncbi:hypothetical protein AVEN_118623-1 [Araneus ventricosus]|uniref:Uncharacterized protein n=1 Tax=Araneus ventricosus TaxID=182803 RepID=A0A4Y2AXG3_ARAVE|nr:hypothetical protein AVEN_118623-1 [Araneus ventricosus]